ncbi:MAG TPA: hypothetical protein VFH47_07330 [Candidatus Thermoplasmatota archaeon]|nr:hypothetical protein [Candidatus Thermoplasmatota archaeon]
MRLLALLSGISGCVAALFFLVTAFVWFGEPDEGVGTVNGLQAFAWTFLALGIGLFFLDRAGVANREIHVQRSPAGSPASGSGSPYTDAGNEYRLH